MRKGVLLDKKRWTIDDEQDNELSYEALTALKNY